ncbi:MAG: glutaredoxin family protein [Methanomicrobiales archaeon]
MPEYDNCRMIKEFLKAKWVEFDDINVAEDEDARNWFIEKTVHTGAPVFQTGDEFIFGFDQKKMENLLI